MQCSSTRGRIRFYFRGLQGLVFGGLEFEVLGLVSPALQQCRG